MSPAYGFALVTDLPELRSAVSAALPSSGRSQLRLLGTEAVGRAWATCHSVLLGCDALPAARPLLGARNSPSRVALATSHGSRVQVAQGRVDQGRVDHGSVDQDRVDQGGVDQDSGFAGVARIHLPDGRDELSRWLAGTPEQGPAGAVAVIGGRGGAGASVAAVALARAGARAHGGAVLVDADPFGGGLDLALGAEDVPGARWPELAELRGGPRSRWLLAALPSVDGVSVISHRRGESDPPPGADTVAAVIDSCLDAVATVVIDLPRHGSPAVDVALARCAVLVVVVPLEVRACAAATSLLAGVAGGIADVRLLIRGPSPSGLLAQDVALAVGVSAFSEIRAETGLASLVERGEPVAVSPRSPLRRWADDLVAGRAGGGG